MQLTAVVLLSVYSFTALFAIVRADAGSEKQRICQERTLGLMVSACDGCLLPDVGEEELAKVETRAGAPAENGDSLKLTTRNANDVPRHAVETARRCCQRRCPMSEFRNVCCEQRSAMRMFLRL
uniref:Uncharacterized protein n=1 Tax=Plectus sambesii TaxID=2011161 RepID=A0A914VLM7_9BILA